MPVSPSMMSIEPMMSISTGRAVALVPRACIGEVDAVEKRPWSGRKFLPQGDVRLYSLSAPLSHVYRGIEPEYAFR